MPSHLLVQCVRTVHAGEQWFERHSGSRALQAILRHQDGWRDVMRLLTPRELEIVRLAARGFGNKRIADTLAVSEGTVGALVKRGHLTLPSFGALRMFGASRIPGLLPIAEVSRCPQAQSLALGMYQSVPHS